MKYIPNFWLRLFALLFCIWFIFFLLPNDLFNAPKSLVIYDKHHQLMYASVAKDEQWRFPQIDSVPNKIRKCVVEYEDAYFYYHLGINPISLVKSFILNLKKKDIKRGGSTITMQTIRLLLNNPDRNYRNKLYEILLAFRLECTHSKKTILKYYISNAPYGGNVIGIEAASWRYFGKSPSLLSWAEAATLAVLPNQPSYIYPGKNEAKLLQKRDNLLYKLKEKGKISSDDYHLAIAEPLPQKKFKIPAYAYHLATQIGSKNRQSIVHTTLDLTIQKKVMAIVETHQKQNKANLINNVAAIVINSKNAEILAYVGNTSDTIDGNKINMITRPRSSGSTLKPHLYAHMIDAGHITPKSLLEDIPMDINGYEPNNNSYRFDGVVPAQQALVRSLNIPWIKALKTYGYQQFYKNLHDFGFNHFTLSAQHYGLSLVVGGGEVELIELANSFLYLNNILLKKNTNTKAFFTVPDKHYTPNINISSGAVWLTFDALSNVVRPENEDYWQYRQSQKLAWKTGTSHGFRDAWAVGANPKYIIAVWVGNCEGNGRPNLTGIKKAAPILFDILNSLPNTTVSWYEKPIHQLKNTKVCAQSGYLPNNYCDNTITIEIPKNTTLNKVCPYHIAIQLDATANYLVNNSCYPQSQSVFKSWFKLPIVEESYYKAIYPLYKQLPPIHPDCKQMQENVLDIIFPKPNAKIVLHKSIISNKIILEAIHQDVNAKLFWFLDNKYLGSTVNEHKVSMEPIVGKHQLTVQDQLGNVKQISFSTTQ